MSAPDLEDITGFAERARAWIQANLQPAKPSIYESTFRTDLSEEQEYAEVAHGANSSASSMTQGSPASAWRRSTAVRG